MGVYCLLFLKERPLCSVSLRLTATIGCRVAPVVTYNTVKIQHGGNSETAAVQLQYSVIIIFQHPVWVFSVVVNVTNVE